LACCNRAVSDILIPIWVCALVRTTWITSNPFVIVK
jgi:hypothetical protein